MSVTAKLAPALKRLRFPYHPSEGESVIGALASACHEDRLRFLNSALQGGGIPFQQTARIQFADEETAIRLAGVMRTDADTVLPLCYRITAELRDVALGDLILPRMFFELDRRRIGPLALQAKPIHRADWLNRLLPYCPTSLELLVDRCPTCGPLGWRSTRGLDRCESCRTLVPPSVDAGLASGDADDYRHAAALMSRDGAVVAQALHRLPAALNAVPRTTLVGIMLRVGIAFAEGRVPREIGVLSRQPPATLAAVLCTGVRLLQDWPNAIQAAARERLNAMSDDLDAYLRLRNDIRWIDDAERKLAKRDGYHGLMAKEFPTVDGRSAATFAESGRYYTATETNTLLWTTPQELDSLREAGAIGYEKLPSRVRVRARYHADDVDRLRQELRRGEPLGTAASRLDLPVYAIEQLASLVPMLDHPGVLLLRGGHIATQDVDNLIDELGSRSRRNTAPESWVRLNALLARFAGEKPWGAAVIAMLARSSQRPEGAPFWFDRGRPSIRACLVDPAWFGGLRLPRPGPPTGKSVITHISLRDVPDILVTGREEALAAISSASIGIVMHGKGKGVERAALASLVSRIAFSGEAAARSGRNAMSLHRTFAAAGVRRVGGGWCRAELVELGLVEPGPNVGAGHDAGERQRAHTVDA